MCFTEHQLEEPRHIHVIRERVNRVEAMPSRHLNTGIIRNEPTQWKPQKVRIAYASCRKAGGLYTQLLIRVEAGLTGNAKSSSRKEEFEADLQG